MSCVYIESKINRNETKILPNLTIKNTKVDINMCYDNFQLVFMNNMLKCNKLSNHTNTTSCPFLEKL